MASTKSAVDSTSASTPRQSFFSLRPHSATSASASSTAAAAFSTAQSPTSASSSAQEKSAPYVATGLGTGVGSGLGNAPAQALGTDAKSKKPLRAYTRIKVLSMGESNVGKSCLIKRYCEEKFVSRYIATIGVDFGVRTVNVDAKDVKVNFWDLSGHSEFAEIRQDFYKDSQGIMLVYDVTNRKSFTALDGWLLEAAKFGAKPYLTFLVANKADLPKQQRVVSEAEGRQYAAGHDLTYWESSASSGQNVSEMFTAMFKAVVAAAPKPPSLVK